MPELFRASDGVAAPDPDAPIACLTYQSLCQIQDPDMALGNAAERRWIADRARALGVPPAEVERETATWRGEVAERQSREIARIKAAIKREIARGAHEGVELADLLEPTARRRVETLRRLGVGTLVLDECHHLASLWGYVVRAVATLLGDVHLVGLTATPPDELTEQEAELYQGLLGPVDFTIPTPAVVREGFLAPYQELAWLTEPLESEAGWLAEHDLRFRQLVTDLHHKEIGGSLSFPEWVVTRLRVRGTGQGESEMPWVSLQRRHPALARAGLRFLASAGLVLPEGAPRGEGYREPPTLDDWLVLLEDYALRCLAPDPSPAAAERYQAIAAALRDLGYRLTRQGIRRAASDVDLLLANSTAKTLALAEVLACSRSTSEAARGCAHWCCATPSRSANPASRWSACCGRRRAQHPRSSEPSPPTTAPPSSGRCWSPDAGSAVPHTTPTICSRRWRRRPRRPPSPFPGGTRRPTARVWSGWSPRPQRGSRAAGCPWRPASSPPGRHGRWSAPALYSARDGTPRASTAWSISPRPLRACQSGRCAAGRYAWTRATRRRSPPIGTWSASRPISRRAPATTTGSSASTSSCTRHQRTDGSRPGRRTSIQRSAHSRHRPRRSSPRSTARPLPEPETTSWPGRAGGSGRPTAARTATRCWCATAGSARRSRRHPPNECRAIRTSSWARSHSGSPAQPLEGCSPPSPASRLPRLPPPCCPRDLPGQPPAWGGSGPNWRTPCRSTAPPAPSSMPTRTSAR